MSDSVPVPPSGKSLSRRATIMIELPPPPVSAVLIVLNGERLLDRVLSALSFCSEILILDSGSTDHTLEIAGRHRVRVEHEILLALVGAAGRPDGTRPEIAPAQLASFLRHSFTEPHVEL